MRYRKKPVIVEAIEWDGNKIVRLTPPSWVVEALGKNPSEVGSLYRTGDCFYVRTVDGNVAVGSPGYYLVRGVKGELYPCRGDIFRETHEPVPEPISTTQMDLADMGG